MEEIGIIFLNFKARKKSNREIRKLTAILIAANRKYVFYSYISICCVSHHGFVYL